MVVSVTRHARHVDQSRQGGSAFHSLPPLFSYPGHCHFKLPVLIIAITPYLIQYDQTLLTYSLPSYTITSTRIFLSCLMQPLSSYSSRYQYNFPIKVTATGAFLVSATTAILLMISVTRPARNTFASHVPQPCTPLVFSYPSNCHQKLKV